MASILGQNEYFIYISRSKRLGWSKENPLPEIISLLAANIEPAAECLMRGKISRRMRMVKREIPSID
jgi:hypothetical protein